MDDDLYESQFTISQQQKLCRFALERIRPFVESETSRGQLGRKNVEDLDACKYVSSGGVGTRGGRKGVSTRRQLPNSFKKPEENEGLWVPRRSLTDIKTFKGFVDAAAARMIRADSTDTDCMKAAKEWVPRRSLRDIKTFKGLVDAATARMVRADSTDTDCMKAAKERGLIVDQPRLRGLRIYQLRWWPKRGF